MDTLFEFSQDPIWNVLLRFAVALLVQIIVIRFIYFGYSRNKKNIFPFFQMGTMIFLTCILLQHVEIQIGMALGLFAIFAILRYRSQNLPLREMAYFFTVIGISVINAMASFYNPARGFIIINSIIILSVFILELFYHKPKRKNESVVIAYDRLDLLDDERKNELLEDISARTRKKVNKVRIRKYDLIKNSVELEIFYRNSDSEKD